MKIINIEALRLNRPEHELKTKPRRDPWEPRDEVANPMSRYSRFKAHRSLWRPAWEDVWCRVTLEDGTELVTSGDHRLLTNRGWKHVTGTEQGRERRAHLTANDRLRVGALR
jgi:intein/homing endonuclease